MSTKSMRRLSVFAAAVLALPAAGCDDTLPGTANLNHLAGTGPRGRFPLRTGPPPKQLSQRITCSRSKSDKRYSQSIPAHHPSPRFLRMRVGVSLALCLAVHGSRYESTCGLDKKAQGVQMYCGAAARHKLRVSLTYFSSHGP